MSDTSSSQPTPVPSPSGWITASACGLLLIVFGITSWLAVRHTSATSDEPLHSVGAYMLSQYGDYRINPEDPPLWQWWASLPIAHHQLKVDLQSPLYTTVPDVQGRRWTWVFQTFYMTPGNDADAFLTRARGMMLLIGIALGAIIAWWSYRLSGAIAALAATFLFTFDPNFLAHSPLVKNDVAISLVGVALMFATWRAGRRLRPGNVLAVVLLGAAAVVTKFSGPLLLVALAVTLAFRVLVPRPWQIGRRQIKALWGRAVVAGALLLLTGVVAFVGIWTNYRFRYAPAPDGRKWDFAVNVRDTLVNEVGATHPEQPLVTTRELKNAQAHPKPIVRALTFIDGHHLLPQTWTYGMMFVYRSSRMRDSFLMGKRSTVGFRSYFPLAFLFKTPLATLAALALSVAVGLVSVARWRRRSSPSAESNSLPTIWSVACIGLPLVILGYASIQANLNIGLRHIFPLYPLLYIATGCAVAKIWQQWGRNGRVLIMGLAVALCIESVAAFPNYLPFFNRAAGGERGGLELLGDSNLDWGESLPLLAQWQKDHRDRKLYLLYFGSADPGYYGINYTPLPGYINPRGDVPPVWTMPREPGVIAISATYLQGIYLNDELRRIYGVLRGQPPLDVLGGSIYLFEYSP